MLQAKWQLEAIAQFRTVPFASYGIDAMQVFRQLKLCRELHRYRPSALVNVVFPGTWQAPVPMD